MSSYKSRSWEVASFEDLEYIYPKHVLDKFPITTPNPFWKDVTPDEWNNWKWQHRNRVRDLQKLEQVFTLSQQERDGYEKTQGDFNLGISPYYSSLIDADNYFCPLRKQAVSHIDETKVLETDMTDPLNEDGNMPVPGLTHRYKDRVLVTISSHCAMYCRYCTRKRKVSNPSESAHLRELEGMIKYIRDTPTIRDVVVSGGDPLTLSNEKLDWFLGEIRAIPHIEIFRLGTRNPVTLPQRIDQGLCDVLRKHQPVFVNTHFNHVNECTRETLLACTRLADAGCVIGNQSVLLKGVNDKPGDFTALNHKLLLQRVKPYYIYQCDLSKGLHHFRTNIETGMNILRELRGHTSGMASPIFVVDAPGGGGKIPIAPNYIQELTDDKIVFKNYEGNTYTYHQPKPESVPMIPEANPSLATV